MTDQRHTTDDEGLLAELARYFAQTDPVPPNVVAAAQAAIEFRDIEVQIAEMLRDSALEEKELAGVRGVGQRLLSFGAGKRYLEVDVSTLGDRRSVSGYVVPHEPGVLRVDAPGGSLEAEVDERGRFRLARVPSGPVRFSVHIPGRPVFSTGWLAL
jgi:hypothetical protein